MSTGPNRMSDEERAAFHDRVITLYAEGWSIRQISIATGRAFATVRQALIDTDTRVRSRGFPQQRRRTP